ncbi:MAG: OmpA family protein, partial [Saprospiraceae bacterium]|nr:OmpA family protein [Saprospiraceae bacterium]
IVSPTSSSFIDRFTLVTDESWEVSKEQTTFLEYPLSKEAILETQAGLKGGDMQAVVANYYRESTLIEEAKPIWRTQQTSNNWESYQFKKVFMLRNNVMSQASIKINCDDVARIYVNGQFIGSNELSRSLSLWSSKKDFKQLSADFYNKIYTYDIKPYLKAGALNTVIIEAASKPLSNSHAYVCAKLEVDFIENTIALKSDIKPNKPTLKPEKKPVVTPKKTTEKMVVTPKKEVKVALPSVIKPIENEQIGQQKVVEISELNVFKTSNDLKADKLKVGDVFELGNIFFKADDAALNREAQATLLELVTFLKANNGFKIEIGGHTNLIPTNEYAYDLSTKRAKSVIVFLMQNGIAAEKLTYRGYGKSKPKLGEKTVEANQKNQRVEVKILAK